MRKILFIHHASGWGGAPISMIRLINQLDQSKFAVEVLLFKKNSIVASKLAENGIKFKIAQSKFYNKYYFGFIHSEAGYYRWYQLYHLLKFSLLWILSRYYFASKELSKHQFDIVHLNSSIMSDWLAPAHKRGKVIIHIREPFRKGKHDILYYFFKHQMQKYSDQIIAISEDNAKRINIPEKTEVIYEHTEIPTNLPSEDSYRSKKVLYLGGSEYIKGFFTMVNTLDYLDKDIKVYFGGNYISGGSQNLVKRILKFNMWHEKRHEKAIQKIKSHSNAVIIGLTYNVQKYLDEVCCLISPFAKTHFSMPIIEAFASHKPVITTDTDGVREVVHERLNGLIVKVDNANDLGEAINFLCNNVELAKEMGKNGFCQAKDKYSPKNIEKFIALYNRL